MHYRELLKEYHEVLGQVHMTDKEMAELGTKAPQYFEDVKRQDEMAVAVALSAFYPLEEGDIEAAKKRLTVAIGRYYRQYHDKGDDTIQSIEAAAREYPAIAAEIHTKAE